jgi:hypothetical protein
MAKKSAHKVNKAITTGLLEKAGPAPAAFVARSTLKKVEGVIVKSMSPLLKPANWPKIDGQNAVLVGVFTKIFVTKSFTEGSGKNAVQKDGIGVEIVPVGAPAGIALPVTATLKTGLDITGEGKEAQSPYLGRIVEVELLADKIPSKKGNSAWHFLVGIHPENSPALQG